MTQEEIEKELLEIIDTLPGSKEQTEEEWAVVAHAVARALLLIAKAWKEA